MKFIVTNRGHKPIRVDQFGYFDDDNVMRCKGRINNSSLPFNSKQPILLPHDHPYVKLLVLDVQHQHIKCNGTNDTNCSKREVLDSQRPTSCGKGCTLCHRMEGSAYPPVGSPDLPSDRVPLFAHVGLDFAGPLYVCTDKNSSESNKTYLFIHLCSNLSHTLGVSQ